VLIASTLAALFSGFGLQRLLAQAAALRLPQRDTPAAVLSLLYATIEQDIK